MAARFPAASYPSTNIRWPRAAQRQSSGIDPATMSASVIASIIVRVAIVLRFRGTGGSRISEGLARQFDVAPEPSGIR